MTHAPWKKSCYNLDIIQKSRYIILWTKVHIVKAMVFPVVMYECENWIINKVECRRIDALQLWCWRRLLRVSWMVRRKKQSTLKKLNPECSLAGLILKLKLQYFLATWCKVSTHCKKPWWWERLWAGGEWGDRGWDGWMASLTQWTWVWANSRRQWRTGKPGMLQFMVLQRVRHNWLTEHMHPHTF